jgi:lichenan operon transcriptional antiterminator
MHTIADDITFFAAAFFHFLRKKSEAKTDIPCLFCRIGSYYNAIMLTLRQKEIVSILQKRSPILLKELEEHFRIGERSIRNDIREINLDKSVSGFALYVKNANVFLEIQNLHSFEKAQADFISRPVYSFDIPESRVEYILARLLAAHDYVTSQQLQNEMFVSSSSLTQDLAKVRKILDEHQLSLKTRPHYGMCIQGSELQKRNLIVARGIKLGNNVDKPFEVNGIDTDPISHILTEALLKWEFRISDVVFQNLVMHLSTSILRLRSGFILECSEELPLVYKHAQYIFGI